MTKDPWDWLGSPEEQVWKPVHVEAIGRRVEFSIPDRAGKWGSHTEYWPDTESAIQGLNFQLEFERIYMPVTFVARFWWDKWWGGFYKKGGTDFSLSVSIWYLESDVNLLDLTVNQRIEQIHEHWHMRFANSAKENDPFLERFVQNFRGDSFKTDSGLYFVSHNAPRMSSEYQEFVIPLSDQHYINFSFYVNDLRADFEEDPQWNQSRWEIVEKIMKTVRITPDPFGDQPEEIPAR